jgi:hypothetical protein
MGLGHRVLRTALSVSVKRSGAVDQRPTPRPPCNNTDFSTLELTPPQIPSSSSVKCVNIWGLSEPDD